MPKGLVSGFIALALTCAQALNAAPTAPPEPLQVRIWNTESKQFFPERDDADLRVPWLDDSRPLGIAFSGGGTRAGAAALGQLRALRMLGWMRNAGYVSAVSGGSWTAVPYIYLQGGEREEEVFLGDYYCPEDLHEKELNLQPEGSMTQAINHARVALKSIGHMLLLQGDESYSEGLNDIFLKPFGLGDRSKFFSSHQKAVDSALAANPLLRADDFLLPRKDRPYLIVGATLIAKPGPRKRYEQFPVEITPLYTGIQGRFPGRNGKYVGGGFVESFGYDSRLDLIQPPASVDRTMATVSLGSGRHRFTLSDAIGSSGAAPQGFLNRLFLDMIGFPEFRSWPIRRDAQELEYAYGDGGHIDNIGLLPLLSRRVPKIIVFINSTATFDPNKDPLKEYPMYGDLIHYFRDPAPGGPPATEADERTAGDFTKIRPSKDPSKVVIVDGEKRLQELFKEFKAKREKDLPLWSCDNYKIKGNPWFGVTPYDASICWVYLDGTQGWLKRLDKKDKLLQKVTKEPFPRYGTFFHARIEVIRLTPAETNALSNFTAWSVLEASDDMRKVLGLPEAPPGSLPRQCRSDTAGTEGK